MELLIELLSKIAPLSPALEAHLRHIIHPVDFKKGDEILVPGQKCERIFFIEKGLVCGYHLVDGKKVTDWLTKEGDICISVLSFLTKMPTIETNIALEDCTCWEITRDQLYETYDRLDGFDRHGRIILEKYYGILALRNAQVLMLDPLERYEKLIESTPEFAARVPNVYLASYLAMPERTLSKVKKDYTDKKKAASRNKLA